MVTKQSTSPVAEDGVLIDPAFLESLKFRTYDPRVVEFGKKAFPLDVYSVEIKTRPNHQFDPLLKGE